MKIIFLIGALGDGLLAIEWYLISLGLVDLPIHPSFFEGSGEDFQFVLSVSAIFMTGWAVIMYWGSLRPVERKDILLITAVMLFIAILSDGIIFGHLLSSRQILLGTSAKLFLVVLFSAGYWYAKRAEVQRLSRR